MSSDEEFPPTGSLLRGLTILEIVASTADPTSVTDIAEQTRLDKGTVSRLVKQLVESGYLKRDSGRLVSLDTRVLRLTKGYEADRSLREVAREAMEHLSRKFHASVHLAVPSKYQVVYLDQVRPRSEVQISLIIGDHADQHVTATGRAMMFTLPVDEQMRRIRVLTSDPASPELGFNLSEYVIARESFLRDGFTALSRADGITRIAAPVVDVRGLPIASIGIFLATSRLNRQEVETIGRECVNECRKLSNRVGG